MSKGDLWEGEVELSVEVELVEGGTGEGKLWEDSGEGEAVREVMARLEESDGGGLGGELCGEAGEGAQLGWEGGRGGGLWESG